MREVSHLPLVGDGVELPLLLNRLNMRAMFPLSDNVVPLKLKELVAEFDSMFSDEDELSCLKDFKVSD